MVGREVQWKKEQYWGQLYLESPTSFDFTWSVDEIHPQRFQETGLQYLDRNIVKVIFHDPATIINWKDGTKTVVKTQNGEIFDKEKGFAMAIMKYLSGNKGNFNSVVKKWCE